MSNEEVARERESTLHELEEWLEKPMLVLGGVWLVLLVVELTRGLSRAFELLGTGIWVVFVADFCVRLALAPRKRAYLQRNWLTILSLLVPAIRVLRLVRVVRVLRVARATRSLRLLRVVGSINRGMRSLGRAMARRGFGYVLAMTVVVTFVGAAGMLAFEREAPDGSALEDYGTALWWTAMIMTTMGSDYWPKTAEGRVLCLFLALYAFAVFGYVTATLATFFIGKDAKSGAAAASGQRMGALQEEIAALRRDLARRQGDDRDPAPPAS